MSPHGRCTCTTGWLPSRIAWPQVTNGQKLEVLEHGRRFLKVKTEKNEIGWLEERGRDRQQRPMRRLTSWLNSTRTIRWLPPACCATISICTFFPAGRPTTSTAARKRQNPTAGSGLGSEDHSGGLGNKQAGGPCRRGKESRPWHLKDAGDGQTTFSSQRFHPSLAKLQAGCRERARKSSRAGSQDSPRPHRPIPLEDWWLVRDAQGRTGWLLASRMDVDVPDEIGTYAEGQRIVGAYVLTKIMDPEASTPNHEVPEYVTVLTPPKWGLPFDFDHVRVFTWSVRRHRYETAFRVHPIQGYLPLKVSTQPSASGSAPVFSFQIANGTNVTTDPLTGITRPAATRTIQYVMVDTQVRRTGADLGPLPTTRSADSDPNSPKDKKGKTKPAKKKKR